MRNQKEFNKVGINQNIRAALAIFLSGVELRRFNNSLARIVLSSVRGQFKTGGVFDDSDNELFLQLELLFEFLHTLEEEFEEA